MSSSSDQARGLIVLNGRVYSAKEVLAALERQAMMSLRVVSDVLWIGNERVRPFSKVSAAQAMTLTCFGSLTYCCDLSRECGLRDEALRLLGMGKEEYRDIHRECHERFLRFAEQHWPLDAATASSRQTFHGSPAPLSDSTQDAESLTDWLRRIQPGEDSRRSERTRATAGSSASAVNLGGLFEGAPDDFEPLPYGEPLSAVVSKLTQRVGELDSDLWQHTSTPVYSSPSKPATASRTFCIFCGQDLKEGADFCSRCGRSQK
jgi:hypothetical protein